MNPNQTEEQWIDLKPMFQQMHDALAGQFSGLVALIARATSGLIS